MGPGTRSTAKPRPAHLQMEPSSAAIEATAQLEPEWGEERGVPWDLEEACTLRAVSAVTATPHTVLSFHQENTHPEQKKEQRIPAPHELGS